MPGIPGQNRWIMSLSTSDKVYYGKIMLFGEYAVMLGAAALTVPLKKYRAYWDRTQPEKPHHHDGRESARLLYDFLVYLNAQAELSALLDLQAFKKDLDEGLYFVSEIPLAYGAGSSGALVAAVYERYSKKKIENAGELKSLLGLMENHFHGQSSGIDPLSCYFSRPLLLQNERFKIIDNPLKELPVPAAAFLIDTQTTGKTAPLVAHFREQLQQYRFYKQLRDVFLPGTDQCIQALIQGDQSVFFNNLEKVSRFQWNHLQPMIPASIHPLWQQGLASGDFFLKLCGSGGGGFLLGFTTDLDHLKKMKRDIFPDIHI